MNGKKIIVASSVCALGAMAFMCACAKSDGIGKVSSRSSEASAVTNENGSVSRSFTECTVSTNGGMVTEHRRETRTTTDTEGNMLETSTSEYAQSYPVGDVGLQSSLVTKVSEPSGGSDSAASFLGLSFGAKFDATNLVSDVTEPTLMRSRFKPKRELAGFDDYFVYVTPSTHRIVKICACAKEAVEPGIRWKRHYLIEALENRYQTWARLCSYSRPCYAFDLGGGRFVTACLDDASREYETVLVGWDSNLLRVAAEETEALRDVARKAAAEKRRSRVRDAADAF